MGRFYSSCPQLSMRFALAGVIETRAVSDHTPLTEVAFLLHSEVKPLP